MTIEPGTCRFSMVETIEEFKEVTGYKLMNYLKKIIQG
jgi:hypothetical protein